MRGSLGNRRWQLRAASEVEAAKEYNRRASALFGKHARLNLV